MNEREPKRYIYNCKNLLRNFPTHRHGGEFWEALGRTVATFGFLEEILGRAIFSFTATREFPEDQIEDAFKKWIPILERALSGSLGGLIVTYEKAVRDNKASTIKNLDDLLENLRRANETRNVLCHGSWQPPDKHGRSIPRFVDKKIRVFESAIGVAYLNQVQRHVAELACEVVNTVTHMGLQFPGSHGPGNPIFK